ncbi:MAG TPA: hypothetical protein VGC71_00470 [Gaiellales bacterium]
MTASIVKMMGYVDGSPTKANSYTSTTGGCRDYLHNRVQAGATGFKWMRMTLSWSMVQPSAPTYAEGDVGATFNFYNTDPQAQQWFRWLDDIVAACNQDGVFVNLCLSQYYPAWTYPGSPATEPGSDGKGRSQRLPKNVAGGSHWALWATYLYLRYFGSFGGTLNPGGPGSSGGPRGNPKAGWIGAFEFCNEPNLYAWNNTDFNDSTVARMFMTIDGILNFWGAACGVVGPALSDRPSTTFSGGGVDCIYAKAFADRVLGGLANWRPTNYFAWSHHNYRDMLRSSSGTVGDTTSVTDIANSLRDQNWRGGGDRNIWVTEGAYVLDAAYDDVATQKAAISNTRKVLQAHPNAVTMPQYQLNNVVNESFRSGFTLAGSYDPATGVFRPGTRLGSAATFADLT